jgi:hypothetical protein
MDVDPAHTGMTMSYMDMDLMPETKYYYRVAATNAAGTGEWSESDSATTMAEALGKASNIMEGSFNSGGTVQVDWTAATNAAGYVIYVVNVEQIADADGEVLTRAVNDGAAETFLIDGLTVGDRYDIYVVATASGQDAQWPAAAVRVTAAQ